VVVLTGAGCVFAGAFRVDAGGALYLTGALRVWAAGAFRVDAGGALYLTGALRVWAAGAEYVRVRAAEPELPAGGE